MSTGQQEPSFYAAIQEGRQVGRTVYEDAAGAVRVIRNLFMLLLWLVTLPAEVLLHVRFGVRYLNMLTAFLGLGVLVGLARFMEAGGNDVLYMGVMIFLYVPLAITHLVRANVEQRWGTARWHSRCPGMPWPFWKYIPGASPEIVSQFVEPAILIVFGLVLSTHADQFGQLLMVMGGALFIKYWIANRQLQAMVLDQIDQQIQAEAISEMLREREERSEKPWIDNGFVVPKSAKKYLDQLAPSVEDAMRAVAEQRDAGRDAADSAGGAPRSEVSVMRRPGRAGSGPETSAALDEGTDGPRALPGDQPER